MKRQIRATIIATIITALIIVSCAYAMPANAEQEVYPKLTIVISSVRIENNLWVVDCQDKEGNVWSFFEDEGAWKQGDIANLLMMAMENDEDEVIEAYWEGYTEHISTFFQMMEGRV